MQDSADEIIDIQTSLMVGMANELSTIQAKITGEQAGILTLAES